MNHDDTIDHDVLAALLHAHGASLHVTLDDVHTDDDGRARGGLHVRREGGDLDITYLVSRAWLDEERALNPDGVIDDVLAMVAFYVREGLEPGSEWRDLEACSN